MATRNEGNIKVSEDFLSWLLQVGFDFDQACTPLICLFGVLSNFLSVVLYFRDSNFRRHTSFYYLSALALSDTGFLLNLFAVWFEGKYGGIITSAFLCPLVMYLGQVTCFVSIYVTAAFSIERYVAVHYPLSRRYICTKSRAKNVIRGIILVSMLLFSYVWFIAKVIEVESTPKRNMSLKNVLNKWHPRNFTTIKEHSKFFYENSTIPIKISSTAVPSLDIDKLLKLLELLKKKVDNQDNEKETTLFSADENPKGKSYKLSLEILNPYDLRNYTNQSSPTVAPNPKTCYKYCSVPKQFYTISQTANYIEFVVTLIIPFLLITFCNLTIARKLWKHRSERKLIFATSLKPESSQNSNSCNSQPDHENPGKLRLRDSSANAEENCITPTASPSVRKNHCSSEIRTTKLLLLVSTVFLLLNLPLHVIRCAQFVQKLSETKKGWKILAALQPWANLLFNLNFSVNVFFYCASGKNFHSFFKQVASSTIRRFRQHISFRQNTHPQTRLQREKKVETEENSCSAMDSHKRTSSSGSSSSSVVQHMVLVEMVSARNSCTV